MSGLCSSLLTNPPSTGKPAPASAASESFGPPAAAMGASRVSSTAMTGICKTVTVARQGAGSKCRTARHRLQSAGTRSLHRARTATTATSTSMTGVRPDVSSHRGTSAKSPERSVTRSDDSRVLRKGERFSAPCSGSTTLASWLPQSKAPHASTARVPSVACLFILCGADPVAFPPPRRLPPPGSRRRASPTRA